MARSRNIKVWLCVACITLASSAAAPAQSPLKLDIIDMAAISRMSPQQLELLAEGLAVEEIMRTKRSSAQALSSVVSKASSGLQGKVGLLGQASAGAASFIASASSASSKSGHDEHTGYSYEPHEEKVDFWGLKKSILYTLFQAVKAITGGVTILKGQLIKGGGALATSLGKVIAVKGDAVSNLGKKIVSSAALSNKKPHSTPVYGPPPVHVEYAPPSAYGAPTAPAHFAHSAPSAPTGYAAHKYPSHLDGRGKLNGVHAGLVFLTPLDAHEIPTQSGHTALEPPPSIINSVYSAIKNAFSPAPSATAVEEPNYQPPPLPPPIPNFKPMSWGAVDSYGQPAAADAYTDYNPRNPHPPFDHASAKYSVTPTKRVVVKPHGLTADKLHKIHQNLDKLNAYLYGNNVQRSSEELKFNGLEAYKALMEKGVMTPTQVVADNEIGVLPADLLPELTTTASTTTTTTTTTVKPASDSEKENKRERKDLKYFLRGNRIVVHG